jgi:hypothetical protein
LVKAEAVNGSVSCWASPEAEERCWLRKTRRRLLDEKAPALLEFALTFPILLAFTIVCVQLCLHWDASTMANHTAFTVARMAKVHPEWFKEQSVVDGLSLVSQCPKAVVASSLLMGAATRGSDADPAEALIGTLTDLIGGVGVSKALGGIEGTLLGVKANDRFWASYHRRCAIAGKRITVGVLYKNLFSESSIPIPGSSNSIKILVPDVQFRRILALRLAKKSLGENSVLGDNSARLPAHAAVVRVCYPMFLQWTAVDDLLRLGRRTTVWDIPQLVKLLGQEEEYKKWLNEFQDKADKSNKAMQQIEDALLDKLPNPGSYAQGLYTMVLEPIDAKIATLDSLFHEGSPPAYEAPDADKLQQEAEETGRRASAEHEKNLLAEIEKRGEKWRRAGEDRIRLTRELKRAKRELGTLEANRPGADATAEEREAWQQEVTAKRQQINTLTTQKEAAEAREAAAKQSFEDLRNEKADEDLAVWPDPKKPDGSVNDVYTRVEAAYNQKRAEVSNALK